MRISCLISERRSQRAVSRILFPPSPLRTTADDDHSSSPVIADRIQQPTRRPSDGPSSLPIWSCSVRGFACHPCYHGRRGALTAPFHHCHPRPEPRVRLCVFCATFLQVALTGRYPAHCPAEFGLSSPP